MPQMRGSRRENERKRANSETHAANAASSTTAPVQTFATAAAANVGQQGNGGGAGPTTMTSTTGTATGTGNQNQQPQNNLENGNGISAASSSGASAACKSTMSVNTHNGVTEEITDGCCCPSECIVGEPIDPNDPDDAVPVICSNPDCKAGQFMHRICFDTWEESVLTHVRVSGRARNWSEKQMMQNLWTKKGFDVAYKACGCKCGHGHLRKDLDAHVTRAAPVMDDDARKRRNRKKSGGKQPTLNGNGQGIGGCNASMIRPRSRTLSLGSAAGLNAMPSPNSPPMQQQQKSSSNLDFFFDSQVQNTGSIFQRRETMASFYNLLPAWKVNGIHIKMEDDCPQGNDETRIFVLTSLGDHKMRKVPCVLCRSELPVYDKYPLLDGTFFMGPVNHCGLGVKVRHDTKDGYLMALCISCLEHAHQFRCKKCGADRWFLGDRLILGTLYHYDVLSSVQCCPPTCTFCKQTLPMPSSHYFSTYSECIVCPNCGTSDLHFVRQLENIQRIESLGLA